jgi:hypothetical protein
MDFFSAHPLAKPLSFLLLFVIIWIFMSGGLAMAAGWPSLAGKFRQMQPLLGERFTSVSGAIGNGRLPVGYRSCLSVVVGQTGFSLAVVFPFRLFSPPLFIPWHEVDTVAEEKLLLARYFAVHLRGQGQVIYLRGSAGQQIKDGFESTLRQSML